MKSSPCAYCSRIVTSKAFLFSLWSMIAIITAILENDSNNYSIFRGVFWHTIDQTSLYAEYPEEYFDTNHYGPFFSLIVAPFAILPRWTGLLLWHIALALSLYFAIKTSTLKNQQKVFVLLFCANELFTALDQSQFNVATATLIFLTFTFIEKEKDIWAALCIVAGTYVKLLGIVGLAFFFFSRHKTKLVISIIAWSIIAFFLPMIISSPEYILGQYSEWYDSLADKNGLNQFAFYQNISVLGMVRKISGNPSYSDLWIIIPALMLFAIPYLRRDKYSCSSFRLMFLASTLMFVVLFSTSSESCSYIIPLVGVVLWYACVPWKRTRWDLALLIFVFVITSLSPTEIFPAYIRKHIIQPYALKAFPVMIVWLKLTYEMCTKSYR